MKLNITLLIIAGLFCKSKTNERLAKKAQQFFGANDSDVVSIDLEGLNDVEEVRSYIQTQITTLSKSGKKVGIIGHSTGGQQALHFRYDPAVAFIVAVDPPNHNPFWLPLRAWLLSAKYAWPTLMNKSFQPSHKDSEALFGRSLPAEMRGNSRGKLVRQIMFGSYAGNKAKEAEDEVGCPCLLVGTTGDPLIVEDSVDFTHTEIDGSNLLILDHSDHFPQVGSMADINMDEILESIKEMLRDNGASRPGTN